MEVGGLDKEVGYLRTCKIIDVDVDVNGGGVECNDGLIILDAKTWLFNATKLCASVIMSTYFLYCLAEEFQNMSIVLYWQSEN